MIFSWRGGEGGLGKKSFFMTRGGGGVWQKIILHDEGGRRGQARSDFVWHGGFGVAKKCFFSPTKIGNFVSQLFKELLWASKVTL